MTTLVFFREPYEPKPILGAALTLVSGHTAKMDVVEIEIDKKVLMIKNYKKV